MMTIAEATAINRVLNYFLELDQNDDPEKAREACAYLAERADKALHAGIRSADVIRAWPLDLEEQGRRLANQRDDLIADGVDPAVLEIPRSPRPARSRRDD